MRQLNAKGNDMAILMAILTVVVWMVLTCTVFAMAERMGKAKNGKLTRLAGFGLWVCGASMVWELARYLIA